MPVPDPVLELVAAGRPVVDIGCRGSWWRFDDVVAGPLGREFARKAALDHD